MTSRVARFMPLIQGRESVMPIDGRYSIDSAVEWCRTWAEIIGYDRFSIWEQDEANDKYEIIFASEEYDER